MTQIGSNYKPSPRALWPAPPNHLQMNGATARDPNSLSLNHGNESRLPSKNWEKRTGYTHPLLSLDINNSTDSLLSFDIKSVEFEDSISRAWPHHCALVVREILETEQDYVKALGDIIKVW